MTIKYEKVDSNNIRKWTKEDTVLNKQDLIDEKSNWNFIVKMADNILDKISMAGATYSKTQAQAKVDEIDALLDLFNDTTTKETIPFIDE